jgi:HK97 family phage major capsid protein/HK97 family phage prohead protease
MSDMIGRAYSLLEIKSVDADERVIEGVASTPSPDRMDDIVESAGAQFTMPMPLLWQHRSGEPVGHVEFAQVTDAGIPFKARIAKIAEPGELQNLTDKAWQAVKNKLVRGVSIGFRALDMEPIKESKNFGVRFKKWEWLELSLVTIPANADASIQIIRSIDADVLAASGRKSTAAQPPLLASQGKSTVVKAQEAKMATTKKTIAEQISAFEATRQAKAARMTEIMEKAAEEAVTLDTAQQEEYDGLEREVKAVDDHLVRLNKLDTANKAVAKPINGQTEKDGSESRGTGTGVITVKRNLPAALPFTRYVRALAMARGNRMEAMEISKQWADSTPEVEQVLRAAVAAGTTTDATWAGPLVQYQQMQSEFIALLRTATILGRIPGLRRVPFNISIPTQTAGTMAQWVGELVSKPVSKLAFGSLTLRFTKVANIVVMSDELVRFSNPSAEAIVRDDLVKGVAEFLDQQFTNPTVAEVVNVSPASITNGAPNHAATGTTAEALRNDLKLMLASFSGANIPPQGLTVLMESNIAASIGMMMNPLGQREFDSISADGGSLFGYNVIVSDSLRAGDVIFLKPSEILLADDGDVTIDISREASLQLDSNPAEPPTGMMSLWQQNAVGVRAERFINWKRRRLESVFYLTGADYGNAAS